MTDRFLRQQEIVPRQRIIDCKATVIGVGSIGRQVALQLTAIGVPEIQIIDHDRVDTVNLATQGYIQSDLDRLKVNATADMCRQMNPGVKIQMLNERFRRTMDLGTEIFCCVDDMSTRRHIWQAEKDHVHFFCDSRMSAESLRIITACDSQSRDYYPQTLFSSDQAYQDRCTAKSTIYCANIGAGLMLSQFTKYLRLMYIEPDIQLNLLASEMNAGAPQ